LQGELLGAMLDLVIRDATASRRSMDDVMRTMLDRFSGTRGFTGKDIENTIAELCGCRVTALFDAYVRGAAPIEFNRYLDLAGLHMEVVWEKTDTPDLSAYAWMERDDNTLRIAIADPASVWGRAGLHTGDQILEINGVTSGSTAEFRDTLRRLHTGDTVAIEVKHRDTIRTATVTITPLDRPKVTIGELAHVTERQRAVLDHWR
jgi:predicted metalloprotease with PDZ domain